MLLMLLGAQIAAAATDPSAASSDQDRITAAEMFAYAEWRDCVLRITHRRSRAIKDPNAVADLAMAGCKVREGEYRRSLLDLAHCYKLADSDGFATRNATQARKGLRGIALKELE